MDGHCVVPGESAWPWCDSCLSYHHPDNPTCFRLTGTLNRLQLAQRDKTAAQLLHAIDMERRAATRVKRAATLLHKWQKARRRIEKRIGDAEVQRIINSDEATREITQKKNTVQKTIARLTSAPVNAAKEK